MLSQTLEYSLRTILALAHSYKEPLTVRKIADFANVPHAYLQKTTRTLVRAGLVKSQRGRGGGLVLTRAPSEITIWDVVSAVDPINRIEVCPLERKVSDTLCPLHNKIDETIAAIEKSFRECTFAELLSQCGSDGPLCGGTCDSIQSIVDVDLPKE